MSSPVARSQSNYWAGNVAAVLVVAAWANKRVARAPAACTAAAGVANNGVAGVITARESVLTKSITISAQMKGE